MLIAGLVLGIVFMLIGDIVRHRRDHQTLPWDCPHCNTKGFRNKT